VFPDTYLKLGQLREHLVVEGQARSTDQVARILQYLEAYRLNFEKNDIRGAARLIHEAIRAARRANDTGVLRRAEAIEPVLKGGPFGFDIQRMMREFFPDGM